MKTIKEILKEENVIEVPWHVWTKFGEQCKHVDLVGEHAFLTNDGDSGTLKELQTAVEWYVTQLGGKVKWEK
jgi:hypothetical protein